MSDDTGLRPLATGDVIGRRYEIVRLLGVGLLGVSYLAKHLSTGKHVAIKFMRPRLVRNPKDRERFEAAFRSARDLKHEGLVRYGEVGTWEDTVFFTLEYFSGGSLRDLIGTYQDEKKAFSLQESCQLVLKILETVQYLHEQNHTHRNLKPENILVQTRPAGPGKVVRSIKLTGVGLADVVNPTIFAESYINRGEARYLAPELSGFEQSGTPQSDIYSVGVMLYELLVGQPPRGTYLSPTQLRGDLPDHIDDIVEVAMAADSQDRYPSANDMINDIQQSFQGLIVSEKPRTSMRNVMIGLGLALGVIGVAGLYATTVTPEETKRTAVEEAATQDDMVRGQVQANTHQPTEAELKAMVAQHPDMLYIAPGPFVMGRLTREPMKRQIVKTVTKDGKAVLDQDGEPAVKGTGRYVPVASQSEPVLKVVTVPGFYIDRFEFPNRVKNKDGTPVNPVARVTWAQANETCIGGGKRLCTELEWEKACKGPENSIYSYDDQFDEQMCGRGVDDPHPLGTNEACISGYGVADMSGNIREWTDSTGSNSTRRVVKGGLRSNTERGSRCAFSTDENDTYADSTLGFRCCLGLPVPNGDIAPADE